MKVLETDGLKIEIEDLSGQVYYNGDGKRVSGEELEKELVEQVLNLKELLREKGYKRVQIATIQYFYMHRLTRGRFIPLNTMFLARLLKR